jgi:pimeloyl-ACP methyl ester carboxylesterase
VEVDKIELIVTQWDVEKDREPKPTVIDPKKGIHALAQIPPPEGQPPVPPYQYFTYAIKNNHPTESLFCILVGLDEKYAVFSHILLSPKRIRLGPGESTTILNRQGKPRRVFVDLDNKLYEAGVDTVHNTLKLIISTAEISADPLVQKGLNVEYGTRGGEGLPPMANTTLNRLFRSVGTRGSFDPDERLEIGDWTTQDFVMTIFRPLKQVPIPTEGAAQKVSDTVEVLPHPDLAGVNIELTAEETATRDLGSYAVPAMFKLRASEPFTFGAGDKHATAGTNIIRLTGEGLIGEAGEDGKQQYEKVTPDKPLQLTVAVPLAADERLVAYGWDGHYFIPVGYGVPADNKTAIRLNALTPPTSDGQKSIGGSIKIFVQKVANKVLKRDFDIQKLAMLTLDGAGNATRNGKNEIVRESATESLREAVKHADRILLLIHGWIGDTDSMTLCLEKFHKEIVPAYDLVLTFDYENLNTLVPDTARALFDKLKDSGVGAEKQIDIVAHSMGCFVSRWLIEKVPNGAAMVNRLVMLGAPNNGTRLAQIRDLANLALFFGMNRLATHSILTTLALPPEITAVVPSVVIEGISAFLMDKVQKITDHLDMTITLRELKPGSELLNELRDEPLVDGHTIPYRIIAGDTDLVMEHQAEWMGRLQQFAFHESTNLVFLDEPNDTTITVASQREIPEGRAINIKKVTTKSDHISYFYTEDTLNKLVEALAD